MLSHTNGRSQSVCSVPLRKPPVCDQSTTTTNTVVPTNKCKHSQKADQSDVIRISTFYMGERTINQSDESADVLIPFRSSKGRKLLVDCINSSAGEIYMSLSEQFLTQSSPPTCGVATLAMVLNSLHIDPGRVWRKPWRWFTEEMLVSCFPLEKTEETMGLTMEHFGLIAECNGAVAQTFYCSNTSLEDFRSIVKTVFSGNVDDKRLVVAFDRAVLGQTGTGHYSPVGAYSETSDMILILDVARFKYPPYWVPVDTMWRAMRTVDPESRRSRGFFVMSPAPAPPCHNDLGSVLSLSEVDFLTPFFDSTNAPLKRFAANLVHEVRKRILVCPTTGECETIIDCSAFKGGCRTLGYLRRSQEIQDCLDSQMLAGTQFKSEDEMRPIDFFLSSMPQLVHELITLTLLENGITIKEPNVPIPNSAHPCNISLE